MAEDREAKRRLLQRLADQDREPGPVEGRLEELGGSIEKRAAFDRDPKTQGTWANMGNYFGMAREKELRNELMREIPPTEWKARIGGSANDRYWDDVHRPRGDIKGAMESARRRAQRKRRK